MTPVAPPPPAKHTVLLTIEPEPGVMGDPKVLEALTSHGLKVAPLDGTSKMRIEVPGIEARTRGDVATKALEQVRGLVPRRGYLVNIHEVSQNGS